MNPARSPPPGGDPPGRPRSRHPGLTGRRGSLRITAADPDVVREDAVRGLLELVTRHPEVLGLPEKLIADGAQEAAGQAVTYFDGAFYAQRFQSAAGFVMANGCRQGAFFHFQEWKKAWSGHFGGATTGIEPVGDGPRYSARPRNFSVSPEGISVLATGSALAPAWPRRTS